MSGRARLLTPLAALGLAAAVVAALATGPLGAPPGDLLAAATGQGTPQAELALALRLPRVLTALLTGAGLAAAGAALQILFRNPLVAPDLLGVSSGAGLGAAVALLAGAATVGIQLGAFAGGIAATALTLGCARLARTGDPRLSLVLCGIVTGALASAGLGLAAVLAEPYSQLPALTYWLLGSFGRATLSEAALALAPLAVAVAAVLALGSRLDALSLGEDQARALGLSAGRLRLIVVGAAALATSASVAVAGVVGWVGLLAPHAARALVGPAAGRLIPAAMVLGAGLALGVDRLSLALGPAETPVGLLAALIGAPGFLVLFVLSGRRA